MAMRAVSRSDCGMSCFAASSSARVNLVRASSTAVAEPVLLARACASFDRLSARLPIDPVPDVVGTDHQANVALHQVDQVLQRRAIDQLDEAQIEDHRLIEPAGILERAGEIRYTPRAEHAGDYQ